LYKSQARNENNLVGGFSELSLLSSSFLSIPMGWFNCTRVVSEYYLFGHGLEHNERTRCTVWFVGKCKIKGQRLRSDDEEDGVIIKWRFAMSQGK
jgi:hypothetical protein